MKLSATSCNFGPTLLQLYYNFDSTLPISWYQVRRLLDFFGNYVEFLNNYPIELLIFLNKKEIFDRKLISLY